MSICADELQNQFLQECLRLSLSSSTQYLIVDILCQKLYHYNDSCLLKTYIISTSEKAPSCQQNSFATPLGMHKVAEKHGDNAELGTVFKQRLSIGKKYWECPEHLEERLITSRILRLQGLEPGLNQGPLIDSFERFIYIHGTNREHLLGSPITLGCITLSNQDIIDLYNEIPCESLVWIYKSS